MITKKRVRQFPLRESEGEYIFDVESTMEYAPSCQMSNDTHLVSERGPLLSETVRPPTTEFESIRYENTKYRLWTPCFHVKKRVYSDASHQLLLRYRNGFVVTRPFEGCGPDQWVKSTTELRGDIRITTPILGFTSYPFFGYQPIGPWEYNAGLKQICERHRSIAYSHFITDIEDGFSLPRFVAELKDAAGLARNVVGIIEMLRRSGPRGRKLLRSIGRRPDGAVANAHLSTSFGWIPFVKDVYTIIERVMNLRKTIDDYIKGSNTRKTLYFARGVDLSPLFPSLGLDTTEGVDHFDTYQGSPFHLLHPFANGLGLGWIDEPVRLEAKYHCTLDHQYNLPYIKGLRTQLVMDRFGINFSPSDLWELIPFSFVVDWVLPVGKLIAALDQTNAPADVVIYNMCESIKYTLTRSRKYNRVAYIDMKPPRSTWTEWQVPPHSTSLEYSEDVYYRWNVLPKGVKRGDQFKLKTPNGVQLSLAWALATQLTKSKR